MSLLNKLKENAKLMGLETDCEIMPVDFTNPYAALIPKNLLDSKSKKLVVSKLVALDYPDIYDKVKILGYVQPQARLFLPALVILERASSKYNDSDSPNKDDEYINYVKESIDAHVMLDLLEECDELRSAIPASTLVIFVLRQIADAQASSNSIKKQDKPIDAASDSNDEDSDDNDFVNSNDNYMYSEKLEKLISMALLDGEITQQEMNVLTKQASEEGVDLDEFEMVLNSRLYETKQAQQQVANAPVVHPPQSNKRGEIKKCPSCGAVAQSTSTRCADCGHDYDGIEAVSSITKLYDALREIDNKKGNRGAISKVFDPIDSEKSNTIKNFPIPTTKSDILEFFTVALANGYEGEDLLSPAWQAKCEQVIVKAKFSMKHDPEMVNELNNMLEKAKSKSRRKYMFIIGGILFFIIIMVSLLAISEQSI